MAQSKREKEIREEIAKLQGELVTLKGDKMIQCECCGRRTKIKNATIIVENHYISPHGCMGGDYWVFSHEYLFYCTKCDSFNRTYVGSFDKVDYDGQYSEDNMKEGLLDEYRVKTYFLIDTYTDQFGEVLQNYDYGGTIDHIRKKNKEREEHYRNIGCY